MKKLLFSLLVVLAVVAQVPAASPVVISEFMALNNSTLRDEDGTYSDWIEIYNTSTSPVNLGGWYLASSPTNLKKWPFPATNLPPNGFLVVFASNKDRRAAGAPLHTNFKLGGSGEYLALVMPDGVTKATEFAPGFPQQYADIAYGYVMTGAVSTLIAPNANARALVPTADIGNAWRTSGFDATGWSAGTLGVGFDPFGNYGPAIGLNLQAAMLNANASAYVRVPFNATTPAALNFLTLGLRYDDGFVAYLNGTEVLRRNAPANPAWNSSATAVHGPPVPGLLTETFEGAATNYTVSQFATAPAPTVQLAGVNSTGKFLRLLEEGVNGAANAVAFRQAAPGLFETIIADFDFRISNAANNPADGFSFLLIPTSQYGTNGAGLNITSQAAEEPNYQGVFAVGFDVYPHNSQNDVSAHWNGSELVNVTIPKPTLDLAAGVFHHAKVTLQHVAGGARVSVVLTPDINGVAGAPVTAITNLFISGLNPYECRVQFGGRTGGLNLGLDLDNCQFQFQPPQGVIAFEEFDLSASLNLLVSGENMLALQGLNIAAGNSNFLIQPQLLGRALTITGEPTFLYPPTPGTWNGSAGSGVLPGAVTFSPAAGVYTSNSVAVTLSSSSSSATIRYTLDGTLPGTASPIYTNPIVLAANATIRARAEQGELPSKVTAANYVLLDASVTNFSSNLPLVIIDTQGRSIPDGSKIPAYAIFIDTNSTGARTTLLSSNNYVGLLGIGLHGSSSLGFPKKTFAIELNDEAGADLDYALLNQPAGSDWLLYPSYDDKSFLNNVLTHELFGAMGHYAVRCKYAEVFIRNGAGKLTTGDYQGIYILIERIRVDKNRLDISELSAADNTLPALSGGYLFSRDKINDGDLLFTTPSGQQLIVLDPKEDKITVPQYNYLSNHIAAFETSLYGSAWRDPINGYAAYIDVDSFVDFHWIVEFPKNIDGIRISNYMHKDRNGKITMGPVWDWDLSWGNADYLEGGKTNGWYYPQLGDPDDMWLRRLRTDPDFYQKITDRWGQLRDGILNPTNIFARANQITNLLWEAQAREFATWPRLGTYVWPNPNGAAGGWDVDYVNPTTYAGIIEQFKRFVQGRYQWIDQQFLPAPALQTNGHVLSLSAPAGAIYYTLDGSDPRASGGAVAAAGRLYTGSVVLTNNANIVARAFFTNAWSPPVQSLYVITLPPLRITEINYHPANPPTNSPYDDKDFEFVELQNTGTNAFNLSGVRISGGIDFTFAPSELVAVGGPTTNGFDGGGTLFGAFTLGQSPGAYVTNDGPAGNLFNLLNTGTGTVRNRVAFNQTAAGNYDRVTADFDFRASATVTAGGAGVPTVQDFTAAGTAYTLSQGGATAPSVQSADAGSAGNFLRLTPAAGGERGNVAFNRTGIGPFNSIVATFDFRITPPSEGNQADGMSFALLNTASFGTSGTGPGFGEDPNFANSFGVSFDDYNNGTSPAEPNNNHLSLHWNGAQVGNGLTPSFDFSNGRFHRAQITVLFANGNGYVTIRLTPDINGTPGPTETIVQDAVIPGMTPYESRVAFGARTGGAWAAHDVDNVQVAYSANGAASAGLSLLFLPTAQFGTLGAGTTLANFTDIPRVPNALALDLSFNSSNLVNDVALYWNTSLVSSVSLPATTLDLDSGIFHHAQLQLAAANGGVYATITLYANGLGTMGTPVNVCSNLFLPGVVLADNRLEFAARNGGLKTKLDVENLNATFQAFAPLILQPGEVIVVVRNRTAFISRYGGGIRIAGEFSGTLDNAGETLLLSGPVGEPILEFAYDPAWYPTTDGGGYSLEVVNPLAPANGWGQGSSWQPSRVAGGTPGMIGAPVPVVLSIAPAGGNTLSLSWPASAANLKLYVADSLIPPVTWTTVTNVPTISGDALNLTVNGPTNGAAFYRLR